MKHNLDENKERVDPKKRKNIFSDGGVWEQGLQQVTPGNILLNKPKESLPLF